MMRAIVMACMLTLLTAAAPLSAQQHCIGTGCEDAGSARKRGVVAKGSPDPGKVCFNLVMSDPRDSVAVTIRYANGTTWGETFPAAQPGKPSGVQAMAWSKDKPMVCLDAKRVRGATLIQTIPGSKETCANMTGTYINLLLQRRLVVPVCLKKECNGKTY